MADYTSLDQMQTLVNLFNGLLLDHCLIQVSLFNEDRGFPQPNALNIGELLFSPNSKRLYISTGTTWKLMSNNYGYGHASVALSTEVNATTEVSNQHITMLTGDITIGALIDDCHATLGIIVAQDIPNHTAAVKTLHAEIDDYLPWGNLTGDISAQTDLREKLGEREWKLEAGNGITIERDEANKQTTVSVSSGGVGVGKLLNEVELPATQGAVLITDVSNVLALVGQVTIGMMVIDRKNDGGIIMGFTAEHHALIMTYFITPVDSVGGVAQYLGDVTLDGDNLLTVRP